MLQTVWTDFTVYTFIPFYFAFIYIFLFCVFTFAPRVSFSSGEVAPYTASLPGKAAFSSLFCGFGLKGFNSSNEHLARNIPQGILLKFTRKPKLTLDRVQRTARSLSEISFFGNLGENVSADSDSHSKPWRVSPKSLARRERNCHYFKIFSQQDTNFYLEVLFAIQSFSSDFRSEAAPAADDEFRSA